MQEFEELADELAQTDNYAQKSGIESSYEVSSSIGEHRRKAISGSRQDKPRLAQRQSTLHSIQIEQRQRY